MASSERAPASTTEDRVAAAPAQIAAHLGEVVPSTFATLMREDDWLVARVILVVPAEVAPAQRAASLEGRVETGLLDDRWAGATAWVGYVLAGREFTWRTVVRSVVQDVVALDPPVEVRTMSLPQPGSRLEAEGGAEAVPTGEHALLGVSRVVDAQTDQAFARVAGADLKLRTGRGHRINHKVTLRQLLTDLIGAPGLLCTAAGDDRMHSPQLGRCLPAQRRIVLTFAEGEAPDARVGGDVYLTGLHGGHLYTLKSQVEAQGGDSLTLLEPVEVFRYQRRATPRVEVPPGWLEARLVDKSEAEFVAYQVNDISLGGVGLSLAPDLGVAAGQGFRLKIMRRSSPPLEFPVLVAAARRADDHRLRVGLQFVGLDGKQLRILDRLISKIARMGALTRRRPGQG